MRNLWLLIIIIFLIYGCKASFKSNFRNFNAYYNTYFNAKKSYNTGLKKSLEQERSYNTLEPIRIYETPKGAGAEDFENAIEKGASVLRNYDDTKWVDNALEIIGKSYFFRNEYFNAIKKFDELYLNADGTEFRQRSIFWKGRVLLELQANNEAIQFLNEELSLNEGEWKQKLEWQVKAILAEHYIANENWVNALDLLNQSVGKIPKRYNNERGYFLVGQINEKIGDKKAAFNAYDQVDNYYTNYDLQFKAKKKKAEVARDLGNIDEAIRVFRNMVKDDKNLEFISELNYELGKSEQIKGNIKRANEIYLSILRDEFNKPNEKIRALTYNGLAELNRFTFNNFKLATAYYDSSAKLNISANELPEDYDAPNLADSFGSYTSLKLKVYEQDSLLWLGSLSEEAFDSVLKQIEAQKLEELEQLRKKQEAQKNTLITVGINDIEQQNNQLENGFLNSRNRIIIAQDKQRFQAIWGVRPLVDNWRVHTLIINSLVDDSTNSNPNGTMINNTAATIDLNIDLSRIPFTSTDQDSVEDIISTLNYELGNLFFLQLNLPDSASYYFRKVLQERPSSKIIPVTLYCLSELFDIQSDESLAYFYAEQLFTKFPNTEYAIKLAPKYNVTVDDSVFSNSLKLLELYKKIKNNTNLTNVLKAEQLANLAIEYVDEDISDFIFFDSIQEYIKLGKEDSLFVKHYDYWFNAKRNWEVKRTQFTQLKDSLKTAYQDSTINFSSSDSLYYSSISDSVLIEPDFSVSFPYAGVMWDSVRSKIEVFNIVFKNSKYSARIATLKKEFELSVEIADDTNTTTKVNQEVDLRSNNLDYVHCSEHDFTLEIRAGGADFDATLQVLPDVTDEKIKFLFFVNQRGIIDDYKLVSDTIDENLMATYVKAIDEVLSFEPVLINGEAKLVSCEYEFTIPK